MKRFDRRCFVIASTIGAIVAAGTAHAQGLYGGVRLTWNDCGATEAMYYDCGTDTTTLKLFGSFVSPAGLDAVIGYRITITAWEVGNVPWWDYSSGGCREGLWSLSSNRPGPSCTPMASAFASEQTFSRYGGGYGGFTSVTFAANSWLFAPQAITEGEEFYAFTLTLRRPSPSVCEGCCARTCLTAALDFHQEGSEDIRVESYFDGAATWQGGSCGVPGPATTEAASGGCLPTPVQTSTWGSIKALYR